MKCIPKIPARKKAELGLEPKSLPLMDHRQWVICSPSPLSPPPSTEFLLSFRLKELWVPVALTALHMPHSMSASRWHQSHVAISRALGIARQGHFTAEASSPKHPWFLKPHCVQHLCAYIHHWFLGCAALGGLTKITLGVGVLGSTPSSAASSLGDLGRVLWASVSPSVHRVAGQADHQRRPYHIITSSPCLWLRSRSEGLTACLLQTD